MLRRLMLSALALCAFLALEGCGASRLVAPVVSADKPAVLGKNEPVGGPRRPDSPHSGGIREGDGTDTGVGGAGGVDPLGAASDTLFWAGDPVK